jgi:hypothetical protein
LQLAVEQIGPQAEFGSQTCRERALLEVDQIWLCMPAASRDLAQPAADGDRSQTRPVR